ncbi:N(6)-adenine-specific methyltransferase METTL4 isoform X5 [Diceros bicornis minor]|uniref:N(6)-adenine-specific methyltransferase METTL4 isoform X5 n=1 Tax=Diceros bicornis minor TaxID=77932 RepID=UPI0026EB946B|nr:N(6)-adenine-specific methyltransferase METTL4 isoform X5 [Diceros bicornis minor]
MSVVHQLSPGWLLDHLSFINKINYQLHQQHEACCSKNESTSVCFNSLQMDSMSSFGAPATFVASDSTTKPDSDHGGNCEMFIQKYVFRSELFDVTKPYITSAIHKECQQKNEKEDLMNDVKKENFISIIGKKRKRCVVFNQGELDAMEYHTKIRGIILDGSSQLIQEGLKSGFLHPLPEKQDKCSRKTYDVIVIDPPWPNKSVKRSNRYSYLSPLQIKQLPVPKLAAPNCLVVTWVTNRQKHLRFVKEELYPSWSVEIVAEWHWVKITTSGEFVFPLDSPHKKPYEGLILGRVREETALPLRNADVRVLPIPDHKLIVSVPCTLHSHKPPLAEVLKDYIKPDGECLELFARNLQPGWTSWGNEVLKFQHVDYFIAVESRS